MTYLLNTTDLSEYCFIKLSSLPSYTEVSADKTHKDLSDVKLFGSFVYVL